MDKANSLQFLSKECKRNQHSKCHTRWAGLGVEVLCRCKCHKGNDSNVALLQVSIHTDNHQSHADTEWYPVKTGKESVIDE